MTTMKRRRQRIAHATQVTGRHSELVAQSALLAAGFEVAEPVAPEVYDIVIRNPITGAYSRVQVKTVRVRDDREGALVLYARKSNGEPYTEEETDLFAGVHGSDVYLFPCRGLSEYWVTPDNVADRWTLVTKQAERLDAV